jgi:hypothetical protein
MSMLSCRLRSARALRDARLPGGDFFRVWRLPRLFDPYRPELHYMRGPGPKWREKNRSVSAQVPRRSGMS